MSGFVLLVCLGREKIASYETRVLRESEERQRELAEKVLQATFEQLVNQLDSDLANLRTQLPSKRTADMETALDMKYVQDRQKTLAQWICFSLLFFVVGSSYRDVSPWISFLFLVEMMGKNDAPWQSSSFLSCFQGLLRCKQNCFLQPACDLHRICSKCCC